jgi:hypothetical protein
VEVGELEQAEAVEERRQVREFPLALDEADGEEVGAEFFVDAEEAQERGEEGVEGENALEFENAFALVDEAGELVGLAAEAFLVEARAEALAEGGFLGRGGGRDGGVGAAQGVFSAEAGTS